MLLLFPAYLKSQDDSLTSVVSSMTSLERLSLRGCRVPDEGLHALRGLHNLRSLNLQGLSITADALRSIQHLTNLQGLNLHGLAVGASGSMSALSPLTSLTNLNLRW